MKFLVARIPIYTIYYTSRDKVDITTINRTSALLFLSPPSSELMRAGHGISRDAAANENDTHARKFSPLELPSRVHARSAVSASSAFY